VTTEGTCPRCRRAVDAGRAKPPSTREEPAEPMPWHFWLLAGALAVYLGFRALQGIEWLVRQL
jgi:hypothetical protein